jgi:hypothetical protein
MVETCRTFGNLESCETVEVVSQGLIAKVAITLPDASNPEWLDK